MDTNIERRRQRGTALIAVAFLLGITFAVIGSGMAIGRGDAAMNGASLLGLLMLALGAVGIVRLALVAE